MSGDFFHLVDRHRRLLHASCHFAVVHYESDSARRVAVGREHHLEKTLRDHHARVADSLCQFVGQHRAGHYHYGAVGLRPDAAFLLERTPCAGVERIQLGADVGHIERFLHRLAVPLHIACRSHVAPVVARIVVIPRVGASRHAFVCQKRFRTVHCPFGLLAGQFPRHPVWFVGLWIERNVHAKIILDMFGRAGGRRHLVESRDMGRRFRPVGFGIGATR